MHEIQLFYQEVRWEGLRLALFSIVRPIFFNLIDILEDIE
jgi:hypothetical protein